MTGLYAIAITVCCNCSTFLSVSAGSKRVQVKWKNKNQNSSKWKMHFKSSCRHIQSLCVAVREYLSQFVCVYVYAHAQCVEYSLSIFTIHSLHRKYQMKIKKYIIVIKCVHKTLFRCCCYCCCWCPVFPLAPTSPIYKWVSGFTILAAFYLLTLVYHCYVQYILTRNTHTALIHKIRTNL